MTVNRPVGTDDNDDPCPDCGTPGTRGALCDDCLAKFLSDRNAQDDR